MLLLPYRAPELSGSRTPIIIKIEIRYPYTYLHLYAAHNLVLDAFTQ
jgi:hypothetical protein